LYIATVLFVNISTFFYVIISKHIIYNIKNRIIIKGDVFLKKALSNVRPVLVVLGIVVVGFLVCCGLLTLKVILFNA
jgi:hypothetical protein